MNRTAASATQCIRPALRGSMRRDLMRLGLLPCALLALGLSGWFTQRQLQTLDTVFEGEGQAQAEQVAALADLSLYAGDLPALTLIAQGAIRTGPATRVEISNRAGVHVAAGPPPGGPHRRFIAPVLLRDSTQTTAFANAHNPPSAPLGWVQAYRDERPLQQARTTALLTSALLTALALLAAWLAVLHLARHIALPLARISHTVAELQSGHMAARCDLPHIPAEPAPHHELAQLAQNINRLAQHLEQEQQRRSAQAREAAAVALARAAEANQSAQTRSRVLAAAGHDLRQPLHAIGLYIDGLQATATEAQLPTLARLQESTQAMRSMLDDLLEISQLDAQVLVPQRQAVSLAELFATLAIQHADAAARGHVRLLFQDRGLWAHTDPALLQRVLKNLISNAIRHVPLNGTVLVLARRRHGQVQLAVKDNGVGIAPLHHSRVFEEFYQVGNPEHDGRQGFGLGLAICARIAHLLGSQITLRSALSQGSTFALAVPEAQPPRLR